MSMLVPLYLAGLTALALPIIYHLVRRTPRGRQDFSSLMFLAPTPPRLTRRSRLDHLLLLALRLTALALLVFAFARPFLREEAALSVTDLAGRRVALLLDTSASMRRGDLWQQAVKRAEKEIDELNPQDDIALYTFGDRLQTIIGFEQEQSPRTEGKPALVRQRLKALSPGWGGTNLGTALVAVAGEMDSSTDVRQSPLEPQIVIISDFQKGARVDALQAFEWPKRIPVITRPVAAVRSSNAHAHALTSEEETDPEADLRVRVVNAPDSTGDQFFLSWAGDTVQSARADEVSLYVPAGQSRVVRLPRRLETLQADRIVLRGDDHDFDNTWYVVPPRKLDATVVYAGADAAEDAQGIQYYLRLAVANDPLRQVEVVAATNPTPQMLLGEPGPRLVVVSQPVAGDWQTALKSYVDRGGMLMIVPADREAARTLPAFFDDVDLGDAKDPDGQFLLLGEIDFAHPLFVPFASARYSDFTKIHFWKHVPVTMKSPSTTNVIAKFDNGDPALVERLAGKGRILALLSSWKPADSQFALSSKFVTLFGMILDQACGGAELAANVDVNQPATLPKLADEAAFVVKTPDRRAITVPAGESAFTETTAPGIYRAQAGPVESRFAVNLAAAESQTTPIDITQLEQQGVRFGTGLTRSERIERVRQQRDTELESRQKVWRWLIALAVGVLIFETWWAGRAERIIINSAGSVA